MGCDLCGKEVQLFSAIVEGSSLTVCEKCGSYGKILKKIAPHAPARPKKTVAEAPEMIDVLVSDFSSKIKAARNELGLTQEEFANKIAEKASILQKIESGHFEPSIPRAKKLEKVLKIKLVETIEDTPVKVAKGKSTALTIGDMLKFKGQE